MTVVREFRWLLPGLVIFLGLLTVWVIYLRYRLSKQMMKNQFDLEKYRMEQQLLEHRESLLLPRQIDKE